MAKSYSLTPSAMQRTASAVRWVESFLPPAGASPFNFTPGDSPNLGILVASGNTPGYTDANDASDFSNARYHVAPAFCNLNNSSGIDALFSFIQDDRQDAPPVRTMTNLAELASGTHALPMGTLVSFSSVPDTDGNPRYFFNQASPGLILVQLNQTGGSNAAYIGGTLFPPSWRYDLYLPGTLNYDLPSNNVLAQSVPLFTPRFTGSAATYPAAWGLAVINPSLALTSPGTVPSGSGSGSGSGADTPYRLLLAFEAPYEDVDCLMFETGSGS